MKAEFRAARWAPWKLGGRMGQWLVAGLTVLLMSCGGGQEDAPAGRVARVLQEPVAVGEPRGDPAVLMQDDLYALRYIASYADLIQALGADPVAARAHYAAAGRAEGRTVSFDPTAYTASYADLIRAFGVDALAATRHFIVYGWREGRRPTFDALRYEASYGDLIEAFGLDPAAAARHYIVNGFAEGRTSTFDALRYEASYADLIEAFGTDTAAATRHYISMGYREGRRITFDPAGYLAGYPDLQAAFGSDGDAATLHFIRFGFAEGRWWRTPVVAPVLTLELRPVKVFRFSWADVPYATEYRLLEDADSTSGYEQIATIAPGVERRDLTVSLPRRIHARYILQACNRVGCIDSAAVAVTGSLATAVGYFKASNTGPDDWFGYGLALSADGNTLAVGAPYEGSSATGIDGNQGDNSAIGSGAVYVFTRSGTTWSQQAYLKASNSESGDFFGLSLALSADGNTLAVGATGEASSATGINGNQGSNSADNSGAVYVFTRSGTSWTQQAYVKASNTGASDRFGGALALSADGNTLAVGAAGEDSGATGINGNQGDNSTDGSGAVYVFTRSGTAWSQQAYVKASNTDATDYFGSSLAIASDGNTLAVGAAGEDSGATGINGNQGDNSTDGSGAVYVFTRSGTTWSQQAYLKANNTGDGDQFGTSVALSSDGNTLAVGADVEAGGSGAVYVFTRGRAIAIWSQQAYVKASNAGSHDWFGAAIALSADGNRLAVGAWGEASNATGIGGNQDGNAASSSGAVYVFERSGTTWTQRTYVKASNSDAGDEFGVRVALSADGNTLAVAALLEDGGATGISGNQGSNSASDSGAVYLY